MSKLDCIDFEDLGPWLKEELDEIAAATPDVPDYIYHITYLRNLESISEKGLVPEGDDSGFFTEFKGVGFWYEELELRASAMSYRAGRSLDDGGVPVVLGVSTSMLDRYFLNDDGEYDKDYISYDPYGSEDADADAYFISATVPCACMFYVYDGEEWVGLDRLAIGTLEERQSVAYEFVEEDWHGTPRGDVTGYEQATRSVLDEVEGKREVRSYDYGFVEVSGGRWHFADESDIFLPTKGIEK
jgi:hypothetical protein